MSGWAAGTCEAAVLDIMTIMFFYVSVSPNTQKSVDGRSYLTRYLFVIVLLISVLANYLLFLQTHRDYTFL